jgi:hypothetical protein
MMISTIKREHVQRTPPYTVSIRPIMTEPSVVSFKQEKKIGEAYRM